MEICQKVPIEGMTAEEVLSLWLRGELYVKPKKFVDDAMLLALRQREALEYVGAIDCFVAPAWQAHIHELWQAIVGDPLFTDDLLMKKGRKRGLLNYYFLTNIIFQLQALDVYQCENLIELHLKLEGVEEKNSIYKSVGKYKLSKEQKECLRLLKEKSASRK